MAERAIHYFVFAFLANVRVMHLERRENSCAQEFSVRFTRCFGNEKTEDYVTGIAVRPASLWRKFSALFLFQQLQDFGVLNLFLDRKHTSELQSRVELV